MAWWVPWRRSQPSTVDNALTAAATPMSMSKRRATTPNYQTWQAEAWAYYDSLGEFRYAVEWKSEMISRVRLRVGEILPGQDEPRILDSGPAADLINELCGGIGGQSEMLANLATQINVPGEAYVLGETIDRVNYWSVKSADEIRAKRTKFGINPDGSTRYAEYETIDESTSNNTVTNWRPVDPESFLVRVWRPHKRYRHVADSPARAMRSPMRELELVNRKIQAQYLSRLASAGVFVVPDEVTFPTRPEFNDAPDAFVAEWIQMASEAIATPGSASAVVPIPMKVAAEYAKAFNFIDFSLKEDEKTLEKRESAIRRIANQVDVPAEILLGMGDVNHWSAWQLEEGAIKTHISTDVEVICHALSTGYLWPRMRAMGLDPKNFVVWYDTSELTARPNKSDVAKDLYDRLEITGAALRREAGFDEDDAPTDEQLKEMALRKLAINPQVGMAALSELVDEPKLATVGDTGPQQEVPPSQKPEDQQRVPGPPPTKDAPAPKGDAPTPKTAGVDRVMQAASRHRVQFGLNEWTLYHPECCRGSVMTCPVTEGTRHFSVFPGRTGTYECWLSDDGTFILGKLTYERLDNFVQGHTRNLKSKALSNGHH
jgi:hypothetical protein